MVQADRGDGRGKGNKACEDRDGSRVSTTRYTDGDLMNTRQMFVP